MFKWKYGKAHKTVCFVSDILIVHGCCCRVFFDHNFSVYVQLKLRLSVVLSSSLSSAVMVNEFNCLKFVFTVYCPFIGHFSCPMLSF